jgi:hypothetical protein
MVKSGMLWAEYNAQLIYIVMVLREIYAVVNDLDARFAVETKSKFLERLSCKAIINHT